MRRGAIVRGVAPLLALWVMGCAAAGSLRLGGSAAGEAMQQAREALARGDLAAAETLLAPSAGDDATRAAAGQSGAEDAVDRMLLRSQLRVRQGRFAEAEAEALTVLAVLPASPSEAAPAKGTRRGAARQRPTQRSAHLDLARLYEDAGRDDEAEQHLESARTLCEADPALASAGQCATEREALLRIRLARGHYAQAEPLVLAEIADVQQRHGADDLRLSFALCHAARFYARQGNYALSGPLYARSFTVWKSARDDAFAAHVKAAAGSGPEPFEADFLVPRAGHAPFAAPCGLGEQALLLYKQGDAKAAAEAIEFERHVWTDDTEAAIAADAALAALLARDADPLDVAEARHAVAWVALRKGDHDRAEQELRRSVEAYAAAWPRLATSDMRRRGPDYLAAMDSLTTLLRESRRYGEAMALDEAAIQVAGGCSDPFDSLFLDTLLGQARTARETRDAGRALDTAGRYLEAVLRARGDQSPDYAWALRNISYAYLLGDEVDASQRMEMQARAIWARQPAVAPPF